jgi:hypothetical protein
MVQAHGIKALSTHDHVAVEVLDCNHALTTMLGLLLSIWLYNRPQPHQ